MTVRSEGWRLIWNPGADSGTSDPVPELPHLALYDIRRDPLERHDVAAREPQRVRDLQAAARALLAGVETCLSLDPQLVGER